jgi:hypothetical protein
LCHVDSFRAKLKVFLNHLERNSFFFFLSCSILNEEHGTKCDFKKYTYFINSLIAQFDKQFRDFEILRKDLILFENPRTAPIIEQNVNFQSELCDLQSDISLKSRSETGVTLKNFK